MIVALRRLSGCLFVTYFRKSSPFVLFLPPDYNEFLFCFSLCSIGFFPISKFYMPLLKSIFLSMKSRVDVRSFCRCQAESHTASESFVKTNKGKQKRQAVRMTACLFMYSKRDLNPHSHYWPRDFKSLVSTDSTIRASFQRKSGKRDSNSRP